MLYLSRKALESIQIGPDIRVVIREIHKNYIEIGVEAPADMKIHRLHV